SVVAERLAKILEKVTDLLIAYGTHELKGLTSESHGFISNLTLRGWDVQKLLCFLDETQSIAGFEASGQIIIDSQYAVAPDDDFHSGAKLAQDLVGFHGDKLT